MSAPGSERSRIAAGIVLTGVGRRGATGCWARFAPLAALLAGACRSPSADPTPRPSASASAPATLVVTAPAPPAASSAPAPAAPSAAEGAVKPLAQGRFVGTPADGESVEVTLRGDAFELEGLRMSRPPLEELRGHVVWRSGEGCFEPAPASYAPCFRVQSPTRLELTTRDRGDIPPLGCAESGVTFGLTPLPLRRVSHTITKADVTGGPRASADAPVAGGSQRR